MNTKPKSKCEVNFCGMQKFAAGMTGSPLRVAMGIRLQQCRAEMGLSIQEVADWICIGRGAMRLVEEGKSSMLAEDLQVLWLGGYDLMFVLSGVRVPELLNGSIRPDGAGKHRMSYTVEPCLGIGLRLIEERIRIGYPNLDKLEEAFGVNGSTIGTYELGKGTLRADQVENCMQAGYDGHYLITGVRSINEVGCAGQVEFRDHMKIGARGLKEQMGMRLMLERRRLGMSVGMLGSLVGVTKNTVTEWEKGGGSVSSEYMYRLMDAGLNVAYILFGETKKEWFMPSGRAQGKTEAVGGEHAAEVEA